jgi:hypothetical protein
MPAIVWEIKLKVEKNAQTLCTPVKHATYIPGNNTDRIKKMHRHTLYT